MPTAIDIPAERRKLLLERYAPVVYHSSDETCFPTNVDWLLSKTSLCAFDDTTTPDTHAKLIPSPTQLQLIDQAWKAPSGGTEIHSGETRSRKKQCTFYLQDVAHADRAGSMTATDWITYGHVYRNVRGGITLQYWRCYAYNNAINDHGGDWEGLHIVLGADELPVEVVLLGHKDLLRLPIKAVDRVDSHILVYSEGGGHATRSSAAGIMARRKGLVCEMDPRDPLTVVRHESWSGGAVNWFDGRKETCGGIVDVGSKLAPANGQVFIQYSGLWGSPGFLYGTSGYWGPAYNETAMTDSGYVTAWADGMAAPDPNECQPKSWSR